MDREDSRHTFCLQLCFKIDNAKDEEMERVERILWTVSHFMEGLVSRSGSK